MENNINGEIPKESNEENANENNNEEAIHIAPE